MVLGTHSRFTRQLQQYAESHAMARETFAWDAFAPVRQFSAWALRKAGCGAVFLLSETGIVRQNEPRMRFEG
jgi:hypothetical protein